MAITSAMVDIHDLLESYVWEHYRDLDGLKRTKSEFRNMDRDDCVFEINLRRLQIDHEEPDYANLHPTDAKPYSLFRTVFTNNTNRAQEYSFKTERSTESMALVHREQGYTLGQEAEISMKTPCEILEFKAGFKHEMSFSKGAENAVSEMLTWAVDSNIVVPAHYQTQAEMVVEEMKYSGSFRLNSALTGRVTMSILRRRDHACVLSLTANIAEIFRQLLQSGNTSRELKAMTSVDRQIVRLTTKGQCSFQFATKQRITLSENCIGEKELRE